MANSDIDRLKSVAKLSEYASKHISLKRKGAEFVGLSPFSNEKTPSFFINDEKASYYCFSSNEKGDIISLFMHFEKCDFKEALDSLCEIYSIPRSGQSFTPKKNLSPLIDFICEIFKENLLKDKNQLGYLKSRRVSFKAISDFQIGYSVNENNIINELQSRSMMSDDFYRIGLHNDDKKYLFTNCIMFPVCDSYGRVVGFGGRNQSNYGPKYINSPDTEIFNKKEHIYNIHNAKQSKKIVVVEGYMDVVSLYSRGIEGACAIMGTALTKESLSKLWGYCDIPVICTDGDAAGKRSYERAARLAVTMIESGKSLDFAILDSGNDPDDMIRQNKSEFVERLNNPKRLYEVLFDSCLELYDTSRPEDFTSLKNCLTDYAKSIQEKSLMYEYIKIFNQMCREKIGRNYSLSLYDWGVTSEKNKAIKSIPLCLVKMDKDLSDAAAKGIIPITKHHINTYKTFEEACERLGVDSKYIRTLISDDMNVDEKIEVVKAYLS